MKSNDKRSPKWPHMSPDKKDSHDELPPPVAPPPYGTTTGPVFMKQSEPEDSQDVPGESFNRRSVIIFGVLLAFITSLVFIYLVVTSSSEPIEGSSSTSKLEESSQMASYSDDPVLDEEIALDTAKGMESVESYLADNDGKLPATAKDLKVLNQDYLNPDLSSPITKEPYLFVLSAPEPGEFNVLIGECGGDSGDRNHNTGSHQYMIFTPLSTGTLYCVDNS